MPIKKVAKLDELPEPQRAGALKLEDGSYIVDEPVDTAALRAEGQRALDAERERADAAERERKRLEREYAALKREQEAREKGTTKEEIERLRAEDAAARKPLEDKIAALEKENRTLKLDDKVRQIALDKGIMKTRIAKAMKDLDGRFELTADGTGIIVKGADGKATTETVEDFFTKTYKEEAPFFYEGPGGSGSGAEQGGSGSGAGGYDPVAAGKAAAAAQKKDAGQNALAFQ